MALLRSVSVKRTANRVSASRAGAMSEHYQVAPVSILLALLLAPGAYDFRNSLPCSSLKLEARFGIEPSGQQHHEASQVG